MKIISYNVNGIRAAIKKGLLDWIRDEDPDIICIQETKANKDQVETHLINQIELLIILLIHIVGGVIELVQERTIKVGGLITIWYPNLLEKK